MGFRSSAAKLFTKRIAVILGVLIGLNLFVMFRPARQRIKLLEKLNIEQDEENLPLEFQAKLIDERENTSLQDLKDSVKFVREATENKTKKILIWNSYWESKSIWHKLFYELIYQRCPQSNCILTLDKSEINSSDAVLFHIVDLAAENYKFPETRNSEQVWVGMTYEPPYILKYAGLDFTKLNGIFNRTMSYRRDSDIVVRHGVFLKIEKGMLFPNYFSNWIGSQDKISERNYSAGKRRLVAWFASSRGCKSQSGRENYVKDLQNYLPVDIYGSCGKYKCGVQKTMRNPYKVEHDECYLLVSVGYKFILAFENSICEDYVTEKLYNNLKLNTVPIVFGGANYSYYAPPHSVIDASQYTPKELSEYLLKLDKNDTLYNEYFRWKSQYYIEAHDGIPLACDLCLQLNNPQWKTEKKVYDKFDDWIVKGCYEGFKGTEST